MAEIMAWPLNLTAYSYNAQDVMRFMAGKTSGVFGEEGNFQVIAKSGMTVTVQAEGMTGGWLSDGGKYGVSFWNANDIDLTVETADGVNPRKDRVVVSWHIPQQTTVPDVLIRKGTPSASPQPPALVNNGEYAEICLAEINVPAGATEITSYNITDTRLNEELCGLVSMGIEKIPTGGLEAQFMDWFEDLQTNLDGDVALNLQNQITGHISDTKVHLRTLTHSKYGTTHYLTGLSGASGTVSCVFKATANFNAGDTIRIDGTAYTIQLSNGETAGDNLFVSGAAVSVIVDKDYQRVNFKAAGGVKLPAGSIVIVNRFTANGQFTVPATGTYRITAIGPGGDGGNSYYNSSNGYRNSGGGGGSGGVAVLTAALSKGEVYPVTVSTAQCSFGSLISATTGKAGDYTPGGAGGTAAGGDTNFSGNYGENGKAEMNAVSGGGGAGYTEEQIATVPALSFTGGAGGDETPSDGADVPGAGWSSAGLGGGGAGCDRSARSGGTGGNGAVIIELVLE